jgi:hypothetical protein
MIKFNLCCSGGGQDAQGADERAGDLARAVRPDAQAARHHGVGMIAPHVLYVFLLNERTPGSGPLRSIVCTPDLPLA